MTAHAVEHRHRIQGRLGIAHRYWEFALLLLFLAGALPATAQERSRQINEIEARIANLQRDLAALEKEYFQLTQALETNRKNLAEEEPLAAVGGNWVAAANRYLAQIQARKQAFEDASARLEQILPEDQSWLDHIYLGFIKAPQRRIPRAVSGLYDKITARFDWLTYHRTIEAEMRAGIQLGHEPYPRRFESVEDFVRQAQAEVLKSETARSNCVTYRENIARAEQRQSEIDQEQRQLHAQIRQLQQQLAALHNQPVEPAAPTPPRIPVVLVRVDPAFIEATEPQGPAGMRTRTYRFFLLAEETAKAPAKLRLNWLRTDPVLPHRTEPSAYTRRPQTFYSIRPGETEPLRDWEPGDTVQDIYSLLAGVGPDFNSRWAGGAKHLGPFYLTAGEKEQFWGTFTAEIQVLDANDHPQQTLQVRWEPFPRAQDVLGQGVMLTLTTPSAREMGGPWRGGAGAVGGRLVALRLYNVPAELPGGLYWLEIDIERVGAVKICALHRQGERELYLQAYLPVPLGEFKFTIRCPQLPGMPPSTLAVQRFLPPDYVENQRKYLHDKLDGINLSNAELEKERRNPRSTPERIAYAQATLADSLGSTARHLYNLGQYRQALDLIQKAHALLPERGGSSMQLAARGRVMEVETVAAFESADVPGFLAATRRLIHAREDLVAEAMRLNLSPRLALSGLYEAHAVQADGILVLTGDLRVLQTIVPKLRELHPKIDPRGTFEEAVTRAGSSFPCLRAAILTSKYR